VAAAHGRAARKREDFLRKPSLPIARTCDAAITEDLDKHGLAQALNLGKGMGDGGRGMLVPMPGHKLGERGTRLAAGYAGPARTWIWRARDSLSALPRLKRVALGGVCISPLTKNPGLSIVTGSRRP
jgi:hypothetical protein